MKDTPNHMKKLNRQVIRSVHREEMEEANFDAAMPSLPTRKQPIEEQKKIAKQKIRAERMNRTPTHPTEEERNRKMKHRTPVFDRNNAKPRVAKPTRKKTPKI